MIVKTNILPSVKCWSISGVKSGCWSKAWLKSYKIIYTPIDKPKINPTIQHWSGCWSTYNNRSYSWSENT